MEIPIPALITILIFTFIPLWIGELSKRVSLVNVEDFFVQSRKMSLVTLFFTVYATWWSSFAFLGSTSYFYTKGPVYLTAIAWNILFGVLFYFIGKRIWYYGQVYKFITPSDFFTYIYNSKLLGAIVTINMLVFTFPYLQIQLSSGAYLIEVASKGLIPWRFSGLIFYLVIVIYLWEGGLRAVAWTDIFYSFLIFFGMIIGGLYLSNKAGGITYLFQYINKINPDYLLLPGPDGHSGVTLWISMFVMAPIGALMGPQLWIRMYAAKEHSTFSLMPFLLCSATIAYMGSVLAGYSGLLLQPTLDRTDLILPVMLIKYASPWLAAFLFCCGAAAALSTANSQIHAVSAVYSIDIHRKYINKTITDRSLVFVARWLIIIFSAAAYIVLTQSPVLIIQTGLVAFSGTAQVFIPTIGALFWEKSNSKAAISGMLTGITVLIILAFAFHINSSYAGILGLLSNGFVFVLISFISRGDNKVRSRIRDLRKAYEDKHN